MNKQELISKIAEKAGITKKDATAALMALRREDRHPQPRHL